MDDQFSEWDKFYAAWERTSNANRAMRSYKRQRLDLKKDPEERKRLSIEARKKRIEKLRSIIAQRWERRCAMQAKQEAEESASQTKK